MSSRSYTSPLRDQQARQTRDLILDALTELLADRRPDEVTTREIAAAAGVSQPTVYRHFPDRDALLAGLAARLGELTDVHQRPATSIGDFGQMMAALFAASDEFAVGATAEALLNSDPRQYTPETRANSAALYQVVVSDLPELDEQAQLRLAALLRCIGSAQTWLRMREEFGVGGTESGPLVAWAMDTLAREAADNGLPTQ